MSNTEIKYIEVVEQDSVEKVIIAVDSDNYDSVYGIMLRRIEKQYDREDYNSLKEYIEDVIEDLLCGIVEIETTLSITY